MSQNRGYLGNKNLPGVGSTFAYSPEQLVELAKCAEDIQYFAEKYFTIVHVDHGKMLIPLFEYQHRLLTHIKDNRFSAILQARQSGKTTTNTIYILWYVLFHTDKAVAILANKAATSRSILSRIQLAFELLPNWMKPPVKEWNKGSVAFGDDNGCSIVAAATSSASIRGETVALLVIDEAAFVENWKDFYTSTYPTIASGKTTQVILVSTINGMNHYNTIMEKARSQQSEFRPFEVTWRDVPGRDAEWRRITIANTSEEAFEQEHENVAMGSTNTLLKTTTLKDMVRKDPIREDENMQIYAEPESEHAYVGIVDTSRGKGLDNSAISIIDVTSYPFYQVATYYNNDISYLIFPEVVNKLGKYYNDADLVIENNDIGGHICAELNNLYEYENLVNMDTKKYELGLRTTKKVKSIGCATMKDLIEANKLIVNDFNTIFELSQFVRKGTSYQAEKGFHDDLVMTLVLFAYYTTTELFSDAQKSTIANELFGGHVDKMYEDLLPELIIDDGIEDGPAYYSEGGELWVVDSAL